MLNTKSLNARADVLQVRPIVLLAVTDQQLRAAHAYALCAAGFEVVIPDATGAAFSTLRPDIVLIDLTDLHNGVYHNAQSFIWDLLGEVPIVALVPEVGRSSCELARRAGCAAVCLVTCSAEVLAAGLRAVLERS
jgi:DNA-binding NarL/FixJ family response regulator